MALFDVLLLYYYYYYDIYESEYMYRSEPLAGHHTASRITILRVSTYIYIHIRCRVPRKRVKM